MKIFIDPGHGGKDPGAVSKIKESSYTLPYALELGGALSLLGFTVNYSRVSDVYLSLEERCRMANNSGADYFISLHFNAGGGEGIETYALSAGGKAERLADMVQVSLIASTKAVNRGRKFANFQVLRDTNMPAILIEGGFVDSSVDAKNIQSEEYKKKFVQGVTRGICASAGVEWVNPYPSEVNRPIPPPVTSDEDIYLSVRVRSSKADTLVKQIQSMGYATKIMDLA